MRDTGGGHGNTELHQLGGWRNPRNDWRGVTEAQRWEGLVWGYRSTRLSHVWQGRCRGMRRHHKPDVNNPGWGDMQVACASVFITLRIWLEVKFRGSSQAWKMADLCEIADY